jgi:dienelactone hydrolase
MVAIDFRERLLQGLGGPWPELPPVVVKQRELTPQQREMQATAGFRIESITYQSEPGEDIPALLLIPNSVTADRPAPGIAVWHQHNGEWHFGKSEPAGLVGNPMHHTGAALAKLGYVVLCPDAQCFEERQSPHLKDGQYERFEFLRAVVEGRCMAWKNILDMRRAIDVLVSRPEVQPDKLGCYGHSMGSTHTWLVGPWEPRLKCLVGNCCLPTYRGIHDHHLLHCFPNFIPGIFPHGDTPDIAALIAPRALLLNFGELDTGSPIEAVRAGLPVIQQAYDSMHASENFQAFIEPGVGHVLSDAMWNRTTAWFGRHLRG